ncbi:MAG: hypothetical protein HUJ68_02235 [Clostridia bacterium]|nr:hypothetical protein [Clostridia bacterium]
MYTDPDGLKTTVMIIHALTSWEKFANGTHVAVHFSNPGKDKYGDSYGETLYDPSGSYSIGNRNHPTSGTFSGEDANLQNYINDVLGRENGEYLNIYEFETTEEEESAMVEKAMSVGDGAGFSCARNSSKVLGEIGFHKAITPGGVEKQAEKKADSKITVGAGDEKK